MEKGWLGVSIYTCWLLFLWASTIKHGSECRAKPKQFMLDYLKCMSVISRKFTNNQSSIYISTGICLYHTDEFNNSTDSVVWAPLLSVLLENVHSVHTCPVRVSTVPKSFLELLFYNHRVRAQDGRFLVPNC